jgi:hypothetical protein
METVLCVVEESEKRCFNQVRKFSPETGSLLSNFRQECLETSLRRRGGAF